MNNFKDLFLLDPGIVFLNHGSFGACPKQVFETYQAWQRRLEQQPVLFLGREFQSLMRQARQALGEYIHTDPDDLVFIPNATYGANLIARSLKLAPGDEVLTSDHEYGACNNTWEFICRKRGARYKHYPISLPLASTEAFVAEIWKGVTPRTKLIYLSQITSATAQCFPVKELCRKARQAGILTAIDGAHSPGQVELDLSDLEPDFYFGNCHKWMLSPKGAAFLYTRKDHQGLIEPLVVSWGWSADARTTTGSHYIDVLEWTGTRDPAAPLSVPTAIQFMHDYDWVNVRGQCHELLIQALRRITDIKGMPPVYPLDDPANSALPPQMGIAPLPGDTDIDTLKNTLYGKYQIEIPCTEWNARKYLRISIQAYNNESDIEMLLTALRNEIGLRSMAGR